MFTGLPGLSYEESKDCMSWAFGEDWFNLSFPDMDDRWNERHQDIFRIEEYDIVCQSLERIAKAYNQHKNTTLTKG
jgi:hypothetical protein